MASRRVYKGALPFYEILTQIQSNAFGKLEASLIHLFIQKMMESLVGTKVTLSNGIIGRIVLVNRYDPSRPLIEAESNHFVDLSRARDINISKVG
jgi:HD-GYP domain-containing protein (c-di-GMP phosphodiesterase class II)